MDLAAIWPIIQGVLVNLITSLIQGKRDSITIDNINTVVYQEVQAIENQAIKESFDARELDNFLREFLGSVAFLELRLNEISLRLDDLDDQVDRNSDAHERFLSLLDSKLKDAANMKGTQHLTSQDNEPKRRPANEILRDLDNWIARRAR